MFVPFSAFSHNLLGKPKLLSWKHTLPLKKKSRFPLVSDPWKGRFEIFDSRGEKWEPRNPRNLRSPRSPRSPRSSEIQPHSCPAPSAGVRHGQNYGQKPEPLIWWKNKPQAAFGRKCVFFFLAPKHAKKNNITRMLIGDVFYFWCSRQFYNKFWRRNFPEKQLFFDEKNEGNAWFLCT